MFFPTGFRTVPQISVQSLPFCENVRKSCGTQWKYRSNSSRVLRNSTEIFKAQSNNMNLSVIQHKENIPVATDAIDSDSGSVFVDPGHPFRQPYHKTAGQQSDLLLVERCFWQGISETHAIISKPVYNYPGIINCCAKYIMHDIQYFHILHVIKFCIH